MNLPAEKRRQILDAALDEFSQYTFEGSNLNRIVAAAGIAKGSFYQYFDNKKDLYFYLMDTLTERKLAVMAPVIAELAAHTLHDNLRRLFDAAFAFVDADPKLWKLGESFVRGQPALLAEYVQRVTPVGEDFYLRLLAAAKARGELRAGLSLALAASFVATLINHNTIGLIERPLPPPEREAYVRALLDFIEHAVTG